ncbi:MAG: hypothetical protein EPO35_08770 [Acidobacteria bacterium]|nr:MAG: hypothetical protein EPO35_08770 [Acidobacteriota bacterium]
MSQELARHSDESGHPGGARALPEREAALAAREAELAAFLHDLRELRTRYLEEVGILYARLIPIEDAIKAEEVRLGMRLAEIDAEDAAAAIDPFDPACDSRAGVPDGLKTMFRNVAKALHPDLAGHDDADARERRQALMAEANRAYAERDAERLQLILRAWEESPESVAPNHPYGERLRAERRLAQIEQRLVQIDAEMAELRDSAVNRLKISMDEAARYGRDLLKQMTATVEGEIAAATRRLEKLRKR